MAENTNSRLEAILQRFDADWTASEEARTEARNDLFFSRVSQWDDWLNKYTTLQYRGQFDVVRPVVRKLVAEMRQNPIDVMYRPKESANPDSADVLMGMYRTDMRHNTAKTSVNIAVREQIECGVGAWRLVTDYEDQDPTSNNQVIRRVPIHGACSHVIWDGNSQQMDKSDASHCTIIHSLSKNGWTAFAEEFGLDGDDIPSFQSPNTWVFPWFTQNTIHVAEYYEVEEKKELVFIYQDPLSGEPVSYFKREIKDVIDELADKGMVKIGERKVKRRRVYKTILSCSAVLKDRELIAGEHIPIVPVFGEWGFVDDKEVYEGVVRLTKDGQRLRNMIMSFNADIVARTPKKKPIFWPEQIAGYEHMYSGTDDYPYYLVNKTDENNGDLPTQPIAYMDNPEVPQANAYMLEAATNAVKSVATVGVDSEAVNGNQVAFDTINQLNMRSDLETYVFQDNLSTAMRRDGEIYASIVNDIYDVPRNVVMTLPDGSEKDVQVMNEVVDLMTGQRAVLNDVRGRYECYTDVGPSFQSMKEQNRAEIGELLKSVPIEHPAWNVLLLQFLSLLDGKGIDITREYATKQLVVQGLKKPETPEEEQWLAEAQQQSQQQQDPMMVAAMAEQEKAQAEIVNAQTRAQETQIKAFTAQQQAQESQANTIYKLAQARNIDEKAVMDAIKLLNEVAKQQQSNIPTANTGEIPQTM
ncbi:portal protein [Xenorhabdus bovienii]|uniref:portal protein n=2 Tax=Xenorhabdus bovienii TaxID=40576 RepID=UPI00237C5654|nr:portal protein [Xenorhabdus bovienii]MDE1487967.1 portal protein [Xenorhabdus bovienii]MDE9477749.1 portal protein [Xenorhabdus bovienii]MDE9530604.1 portal protein [Xenorhabdus bovienii]